MLNRLCKWSDPDWEGGGRANQSFQGDPNGHQTPSVKLDVGHQQTTHIYTMAASLTVMLTKKVP